MQYHQRQIIAVKNIAEDNEKLFKELKVGDQIELRIPKVERGPLESQNINDYDRHSERRLPC